MQFEINAASTIELIVGQINIYCFGDGFILLCELSRQFIKYPTDESVTSCWREWTSKSFNFSFVRSIKQLGGSDILLPHSSFQADWIRVLDTGLFFIKAPEP